MLTSLANLHWEGGSAARAQEVLQQSAEFCGDHATWRLNLAHTLVAQDGTRLPDAAELYESILQHFTGAAASGAAAAAQPSADMDGASGFPAPAAGSILDVPPSAMANLCVCYVILGQNEVAEDLLRRLEDATAAVQEAAQAAGALLASPPPHLSLANLAIGSLYCAKCNYGKSSGCISGGGQSRLWYWSCAACRAGTATTW